MHDLLKTLLKQEEELQFDSFNNEDAWQLGVMLIEKARANNFCITIDITRNRHQLFHYSFEGTSPDNDEWVKRKTNVVYRFGHSSFYIGRLLKYENSTIEDKYSVSPFEYSAHGGSFPVIIKNCGVIGTITVSGLPQADDHDLVVEVLKEYLAANERA